jgi:hypothetical protein
MGSNQPPSSNEWKGYKTPFMLPSCENHDGAESGVSDTAGRGAVSATYTGPSGNNGINGTNSEENLSARFKYPNVSEDQGAGANQYE